MKPRRDVIPYMSSSDKNVNTSLSLLKLYKRIRLIDPTYKPCNLIGLALALSQLDQLCLCKEHDHFTRRSFGCLISRLHWCRIE